MPPDGGGTLFGQPVVGLADGAAVAMLDRLQASGALTTGKVAVISLKAIAERLGDRWPARRHLAYDHLQRDLERTVGPRSFVQQISDTDYLVAQPDRDQLEGQAACLHCMRHTLHHFLGEARLCDICVHTVTRVGPEGLFGERLDVAEIDAASGGPGDEAAAAGEADDGPKIQWSPFVASNGKRVRVSCSLEPVFQLKTSSRIGYRVARRVVAIPGDAPLSADEVRRLSSSDIERIDFATIERGLGRLKADGGARGPSLILPVSYVTLTSGRGRAVLINLLKSAQDSVELGLICEVCDIEGVPPSALLAAVSLIRPFSLYVFGSLHAPPSQGSGGLKGVGLHGLSMECPASVTGDAEFIAWAKSTQAAARPVGKSAIVYRLPSLRHAAIASLMGATHGTLRPASPSSPS